MPVPGFQQALRGGTAALLVLCSTACAEGAHALSDEAIGDLGKPATVLIVGQWTATLRYPAPPQFQLDQLRLLAEQVGTAANSGQIPNTASDKASALMNGLAAAPLRYMAPPVAFYNGRLVSGTTVGSGFIVTPTGYVVTNAHVVASDTSQVMELMWEGGLAGAMERTIQQLVAVATRSFGGAPSPESVDAMRAGLHQWYASYSELGADARHVLSVVMGRSEAGRGRVPEVHPCEVVAMGEAIPGRDVALLLMSAPTRREAGLVPATNYPTLPLGNDAELVHGDRVHAFGYPAAVLEHEALSDEQLRNPTFTSGSLSGRELTRGGWTSLQVTAEFHHGSSGGPVLNDRGEVIGLATFITRSRGTGELVPGMNFVVPVSLVRDLLNQAGITPAESGLTKEYREGVTLFDQHHFGRALEHLTFARNQAPDNPYVLEKIEETQRRIARGDR